MEKLEGGVVVMWETHPTFGTGKAVVMDSGFFVLKGIIGMLAHGVYGTMVTKKNVLAQLL